MLPREYIQKRVFAYSALYLFVSAILSCTKQFVTKLSVCFSFNDVLEIINVRLVFAFSLISFIFYLFINFVFDCQSLPLSFFPCSKVMNDHS